MNVDGPLNLMFPRNEFLLMLFFLKERNWVAGEEWDDVLKEMVLENVAMLLGSLICIQCSVMGQSKGKRRRRSVSNVFISPSEAADSSCQRDCFVVSFFFVFFGGSFLRNWNVGFVCHLRSIVAGSSEWKWPAVSACCQGLAGSQRPRANQRPRNRRPAGDSSRSSIRTAAIGRPTKWPTGATWATYATSATTTATFRLRLRDRCPLFSSDGSWWWSLGNWMMKAVARVVDFNVSDVEEVDE